jgi:hypothetical protein
VARPSRERLEPVEHDPWVCGSTRLRSFLAYAEKVYGLRALLAGGADARREPKTSAAQVLAAIFFCGLLRVRSLNALEPKLAERQFLRLLDTPLDLQKLCSADTLSRSLRTMDISSLRRLLVAPLAKAERNKVFREGWIGTLRVVAVDGWEPITSFHRHCAECLTRKVKVKRADGSLAEVDQYYHRYVVAMLIDERLDLALDIEPLLPSDFRPEVRGRKAQTDEGEQTAVKRLLRRVKQTYSWVDTVVADAAYANGPFLSLVQQLRMSAVVILRKETDEPLKEALAIWRNKPPDQRVENTDAHERIELWDCRDLETLDTYRGPIRVVRARVTKTNAPAAPSSTWCMAVIGPAARLLKPSQVLAVARGRWHIENTAFHQWTKHWHFNHVFVHDASGIRAVYFLFMAVFNLLTLFLYRQLRCYGRDRGKDVTKTIRRLIDEMRDELARLTSSPWVPDPG